MHKEANIFYISSRGSSACEWLAKMLSRHPQVVCFRSTRTFPPFSPHTFKREISPDDFMEGLLECGRATHFEKIFGSTHAYHGVLAKDACEKRGGRFSFIIRHPVARVHSAYIYYLNKYYQKYKIPVENKDIHDRICFEVLSRENLQKYTDSFKAHGNESSGGIKKLIKKSAKKVLPEAIVETLIQMKWSSQKSKAMMEEKSIQNPPNERDFAGRLFVSIADDFLSHDYQISKGCSIKCGIKMEEMVSSPQYFKNHLWQFVAPDVEVSDAYLKSIFEEKRFNVHRDKALSPKEIWESWPEGMKNVFLKYFESYEISKVCKDFDYDISFL